MLAGRGVGWTPLLRVGDVREAFEGRQRAGFWEPRDTGVSMLDEDQLPALLLAQAPKSSARRQAVVESLFFALGQGAAWTAFGHTHALTLSPCVRLFSFFCLFV